MENSVSVLLVSFNVGGFLANKPCVNNIFQKLASSINSSMAIIVPRSLVCASIVILILSILYKSEISSDKKTFLLMKKATLQYNRSYIYKIITNIDKYPVWYPNIAVVERIQSDSSQTKSHGSEKYRMITKLPLIGNISSILIIQKIDRPKQFIYSVNSWLLEINSIEFKDNPKNLNTTSIEWTVYTTQRNLLFQYLLLPFAKFYKNQIVREALFSLIIQIRKL